MFAKCIDEKGKFKLCPFLVNQHDIPKHLNPITGTIQKFKECQGNKCAAYDDGYCLRLRKE